MQSAKMVDRTVLLTSSISAPADPASLPPPFSLALLVTFYPLAHPLSDLTFYFAKEGKGKYSGSFFPMKSQSAR
jgi:hypothetical protein